MPEETQALIKEIADTLEFQLMVAQATETESISISAYHGLALLKLCDEFLEKEEITNGV